MTPEEKAKFNHPAGRAWLQREWDSIVTNFDKEPHASGLSITNDGTLVVLQVGEAIYGITAEQALAIAESFTGNAHEIIQERTTP